MVSSQYRTPLQNHVTASQSPIFGLETKGDREEEEKIGRRENNMPMSFLVFSPAPDLFYPGLQHGDGATYIWSRFFFPPEPVFHGDTSLFNDVDD